MTLLSWKLSSNLLTSHWKAGNHGTSQMLFLPACIDQDVSGKLGFMVCSPWSGWWQELCEDLSSMEGMKDQQEWMAVLTKLELWQSWQKLGFCLFSIFTKIILRPPLEMRWDYRTIIPSWHVSSKAQARHDRLTGKETMTPFEILGRN